MSTRSNDNPGLRGEDYENWFFKSSDPEKSYRDAQSCMCGEPSLRHTSRAVKGTALFEVGEVKGCPRCGEDHPEVMFEVVTGEGETDPRFLNGLCPETREAFYAIFFPSEQNCTVY